MIVKHIDLTDFRNYGRLDLDVGPSVNVFYGNNAQGKTNIIEAINVASSVSSHRTSKDKEMIRFGTDEFKINLLCEDEVYDSDINFKVTFTDNGKRGLVKRVLEQNNLVIPKISSYIGTFNTVIFAPDDLNLVKGAPVSRRKFLNLLICKVSPVYFDLLGRTKKITEQKNACLKACHGKYTPDCDNKLDYWDFSLSDLSADLIIERFRYCLLLSSKAAAHHSVISDGKEKLIVEYDTLTGVKELFEEFLKRDGMLDQFTSGTLSGGILAQIKRGLSDLLLKKFRSVRESDIEKGLSSTGVQRDDLEIKLNGLSMRQYSSQGQQRSAALALKLSELEILREKVRSSPVLLLDDVFSELDESRRISLLAGMNNAQIFITCTDKAFVESQLGNIVTGSSDVKFYRVEKGEVFPN